MAAASATVGTGSGGSSLLRQAALIGSAYVVFLAFVGFVWWAAWRLSLSKVPLLRECIGGESGGGSAAAAKLSGAASAATGVGVRLRGTTAAV
mmetsp:Transcript_98207/g.177304  ORF Transcript_98207/g.177304 Transcript_98207/m.177304 type:complete len:93 (-) Transcript_98207:154-432(-)